MAWILDVAMFTFDIFKLDLSKLPNLPALGLLPHDCHFILLWLEECGAVGMPGSAGLPTKCAVSCSVYASC
jgi:hypothetical protein